MLVVAVLAYAASYFARGWLAGHQWFALYGALVFVEANARLLFAVAAAVGIASGAVGGRDGDGRGAVRLARRRAARVRAPAQGDRAHETEDEEALGLARGGRFAVAVLVIMAAEQTLLNAGVLLTASEGVVAGYVFNALLIARAPLQLFQAIQGSLLPHLAGLEATQGKDEFERAIRVTILAIAGFAGVVAVGLLLVGPFAMSILFDDDATYGRFGLAAVALGMGAHLAAGTLNQAALARDHARRPPPRGSSARPCSWSGWCSTSSTTSSPAPRSGTSARPCCCVRSSRWCTAGLLRHPRRPRERPPRRVVMPPGQNL